MIGYVYDDGGRSDTGRKGHTGDCLVRAVSIVSGESYEDVYNTVSSMMNDFGYGKSGNAYYNGRKNRSKKRPRGKPSAAKVQLKVLDHYGFKKVSLDKTKPTYTEAYDMFGDCIVTTTKHFAALSGGNLRDTFDGRTYVWEDGEEKERKARSVFIRQC